MTTPQKTKRKSRAKPLPFAWWKNGDLKNPPWKQYPNVSMKLEAIRTGNGPIMSPCGQYYYDPVAAENFENWCHDLVRHWKGKFAGQPLDLMDWQIDLIARPLFGWKKVSNDTRRFREVFLFVPKKNGKTFLAAAVGLYMLAFDGEAGAEVYNVATDEKQANILFKDMRQIIFGHPSLKKIMSLYRTTINFGSSKAEILSATADSKHGLNVSCLLFDEIHTQKTRELYDTLAKGVATRMQPVIFVTTTAGNDKSWLCGQMCDHGRLVIEGGIVEDTLLPVLFEIPDDAPWDDPKIWEQANPSYGITFEADFYEGEATKARNDKRKLNKFLQLQLNKWVSSGEAYIPQDVWRSCEVKMDSEYLQGLESKVCAGGLDLSAKRDLTSFALVFRTPTEKPLELEVENREGKVEVHSINYSLDILTWSWLPDKDITEKSKQDHADYEYWANKEHGSLTLTPGGVVDYNFMIQKLQAEVLPRYKPASVGYDQWGAPQVVSTLESLGHNLIQVIQSPRVFSGPMKLLEALAKDGRVRHNGDPLFSWCLNNTTVKRDANDMLHPDKKRSRGRIDPVVAVIMALSRLTATDQPKTSIYEERGILRF